MDTTLPAKSKLIHIAHIQGNKQKTYLFLRQLDTFRYVWFLENPVNQEIETSIWGGIAEEAIQAGRKNWKIQQFCLLNCGFRYTLPERDEVGVNALFCQMAASYTSANGIYFDDELGLNCIVHNASLDARLLYEKLKTHHRI